jgi:hypothetical protein
MAEIRHRSIGKGPWFFTDFVISASIFPAIDIDNASMPILPVAAKQHGVIYYVQYYILDLLALYLVHPPFDPRPQPGQLVAQPDENAQLAEFPEVAEWVIVLAIVRVLVLHQGLGVGAQLIVVVVQLLPVHKNSFTC